MLYTPGGAGAYGALPNFVGTVATLSAKTELFRLKTFDVALIDEATQILEPQLLGLLCMRGVTGGNAIGKFVLIGDHKQLPAVVLQSSEQSEIQDEGLRGIGLHNLKDSLLNVFIGMPLGNRRLTVGKPLLSTPGFQLSILLICFVVRDV